MKITGVSARPVALEQNETLRTSKRNKNNGCYNSKDTFVKGCATKEVVQQGAQIQAPVASSSSSSGVAPIQAQGKGVEQQIQAPAATSSSSNQAPIQAQQGEVVVEQGKAHKGFFHRFHK
jgi:hypothetical protein